MKKQLIAAIAAATMLTSAFGGLSAGAFEEWSHDENVSVYVNGTKIENEYIPIIVNDRTLVRLVPIFEALGYNSQYDEATKSATFRMNNANASYRFTAESNEATILGTGATSENNNSSYPLDVPATLQYYDVFYVPIRAFCEMVGLDIEWDDATRSVYISSNNNASNVNNANTNTNNNSGNISSQINTTNNRGERIGTEYCCFGRIVGKGTLQEFEEGKYNYNQLTAISESYIEKAPDYKTSTGLKPQQALDLINAAYEQSFSGSVDIYSDYIEVHAVKENLIDTDLCQYRVSYYPNGLGNHVGEPCYVVTASTDETFKDTNSTSRILNKDYNVIDVAN